MRIAGTAVLVAILLSAAGCRTCPPPEILGVERDTPERAFRTLRAAFLTDRPDLIYEALTEGFRREVGFPSKGEFKIFWDTRRERKDEDLNDLVDALAKAELVGEARIRERAEGSRRAEVGFRIPYLMGLAEVTGTVVFEETEVVHVEYDVPGYMPQRSDFFPPGPGFSGRPGVALGIRDGVIVGQLDGAMVGVADASEVRELRFHRVWLLMDVKGLPGNVDVRGMMRDVVGGRESPAN